MTDGQGTTLRLLVSRPIGGRPDEQSTTPAGRGGRGADVPGQSIGANGAENDHHPDQKRWDNRGVAVGDGRVYSGLLDGSFVALDQKTGKIMWRTQLEDYKDGYSLTGAYRYYDGLVFMGISGAENGIRGRVTALDAKDGHKVWRFSTVAGPSGIGGDSWPLATDPDPDKVAAYTHGGSSVWQVVTVPVGTTLTWKNDGSVIHTATAADLSWDTGDISGGGGTAQVTFDTAGTYTFNCTPHPWMIGRVIVQ